jgi:CMP-N,N'-diacetyllegionaminic acid synthase
MKPLVVIPARGGSKGVPKKNIKLLVDKPLINYTIEAAQSIFDDSVICVTTDDVEIKELVESTTSLKVPFLRPAELASDNAGSYEVLLHAVDFYEKNGYSADTIVLLQPTSPFRKDYHILEAMKLYSKEIDMVVSVKETKSNPYYVLYEENSEGFLLKSKDSNIFRRQDCPKVWELNGAIYLINLQSLKESGIGSQKRTVKYVMNEIDSIDIDTILDWKLCEVILTGKW